MVSLTAFLWVARFFHQQGLIYRTQSHHVNWWNLGEQRIYEVVTWFWFDVALFIGTILQMLSHGWTESRNPWEIHHRQQSYLKKLLTSHTFGHHNHFDIFFTN